MVLSRMPSKSTSRRKSANPFSLLLALLVSAPAFGAADEPVPVFETDVLPIFQQHCLACHSESPQHGLDLRDLQKVVKGGESGIVVTPGSARTSLLYQKISTGRMPPGPEKVPLPQIEIIRRWIDAGLTSKQSSGGLAKAVSEREVLLNI